MIVLEIKLALLLMCKQYLHNIDENDCMEICNYTNQNYKDSKFNIKKNEIKHFFSYKILPRQKDMDC